MHQSPSSTARKARHRHAFPALILANLVLAAGPWMVRLADVGPVAAGFWRLALAIPFLAYIGLRQSRGQAFPGWTIIAAVAVGGLFFAADLAVWHEGILLTKMANATLFGNFASFLFAIYGFFLLRRLPGPVQALALALAAIGTALLLGSSFELSPENVTGDLLALLAGVFYTFYLIAVDRARRVMAPWPVLAIATAAGALPILLAGGGATYMLVRRQDRLNVHSAETRVKEILSQAEKNAENTVKEAELKAKDEIFRKREEFNREVEQVTSNSIDWITPSRIQSVPPTPLARRRARSRFVSYAVQAAPRDVKIGGAVFLVDWERSEN